MREYLEPPPKQSFPREPLSGLPLSGSGIGETWSGDEYACSLLPRVHRGRPKTNIALAVVASTFSIVFLVVQCGFWNRRSIISRSARRRLAGDGADGYQHHSIAPSACRDEPLDKQHEEGSFQGTPSTPEADLGAANAGIASAGSFPEDRKTRSHGIVESSQAKLARGEMPVASSLELSQGRLEEQATLMTSGPLYLRFRQPRAVQNVECVADRITPLEHTSTSAVLTNLLSREPTSPHSSGAPTGASGQQKSLLLPIYAERDLQEDSERFLHWLQSKGGNILRRPSQLLLELTQQPHWDAPSTSSAATGGAEAQPHGFAFPQQLPQTAAADSRSSPSASVADSPDQASSSSSTEFSSHIFYRLPEAQPLWFPQPLRVVETRARGDPRDLAGLLNPVREHLVKKRLTYAEMKSLAVSSGKLVRYVKMYMSSDIRVYWAAALVEQLARRFLVLDALLCTCKLAGEAMLETCWWGDVRPSLLSIPDEWKSRLAEGDIFPPKHITVLHGLVSALEQYGQGRRPEAQLVVTLKYEMFFRAPPRSYFARKEWNPWREDHLNSSMLIDAHKTPLLSSILQVLRSQMHISGQAHQSASHSTDSVEASREQVVSADEAAYSQHAEYRLPIVQDLDCLEPIDLQRKHPIGKVPHVGRLIAPVRRLLLKSSLTGEEAQLLVIEAERMLQFAFWKYGKGVKKQKPGRFSASLAARFWVADALWSISEVLSTKMRKPEWWEALMDGLSDAEVPQSFRNSPRGRVAPQGNGANTARFIQRCIDALRVYKRGSRPLPSEVVQLKQIILAKNLINLNGTESETTPPEVDDNS